MSEGSIDLVVSDLDGSLWDHSCTLHPETTACIDWMTARGLPFIAATGRRRVSAADPLQAVGLGALPRVLLNGALGIDDGHVFQLSVFEHDEVASVLDAFALVDHVPCSYVEHEVVDVFCVGEPTTSLRHLALLDGAITVGDRETLVREHDVVGFSVLGVSLPELQRVSASIVESGCGKPVLSADHLYGAHSLMVQPPTISKWDGIERYCDRRGIDSARVAVVGDGVNDVEMLSMAEIAFVPSTGAAVALAVADRVIAPPEDGGWREVHETLDDLG